MKMEKAEIVMKLIYILDAYEGGKELVSNQGQALDGYSALAQFIGLAKKVREERDRNGTAR